MHSNSSHFVTLTYDTKHVPISRNGFMELSKRHVQDFIKGVRQRADREKTNLGTIKYYAAGEYGGKTKRPHYHIILFNAKIQHVLDQWRFGFIHFGQVSGASVAYCFKYIHKKSFRRLHRNDDRQPEFGLMSKKLGLDYLTPEMIKWHKADLLKRMVLNIEDGKVISMPRYYKEKLYTPEEREAIQYANQLLIAAKTKKEGEQSLLDPNFFHNKNEAIKAAFLKMFLQTQKLDKL